MIPKRDGQPLLQAVRKFEQNLVFSQELTITRQVYNLFEKLWNWKWDFLKEVKSSITYLAWFAKARLLGGKWFKRMAWSNSYFLVCAGNGLA